VRGLHAGSPIAWRGLGREAEARPSSAGRSRSSRTRGRRASASGCCCARRAATARRARPSPASSPRTRGRRPTSTSWWPARLATLGDRDAARDWASRDGRSIPRIRGCVDAGPNENGPGVAPWGRGYGRTFSA
jgi:hypothetical protein